MTKRQLIDEIVTLNHTAEPGFLSRFEDGDLREYLEHLQVARLPKQVGQPGRYDKYFVTHSVPPAEFGLCSPPISTETDAAERAALLAAKPPAAPIAETSDEAAEEKLTEPTCDEESEQVAAIAAPSLPSESAGPVAQVVPVAHAGKVADEDVVEVDDASPSARDEAAEDEAADVEPVEEDEDPAEAEMEETAGDSPADDEPTTRRDTITARIAKAWREVPQDAGGLDEGQLDIAEEPAAEAADEADAPSEIETDETPGEEDAEEGAEAADGQAALAMSAAANSAPGRNRKEEDSPSWLF